MTFGDASSSRIWPPRASEVSAGALLLLGSVSIYLGRAAIADERRLLLALAALGFFFAPQSSRSLRLSLWLPALFAVAWGGLAAASGRGGVWLWLACTFLGAFVVLRAGGRAVLHYLPEAESEPGSSRRRSIRRNLQNSVLVFLSVFVSDGTSYELAPVPRLALLFLSAVFFMRYLLLQAKYLELTTARLRFEGLVPSQRWPVLLVLSFLGLVQLPEALAPGGDLGPVLLTALFSFLLASLLFALAVARLGWAERPRRRASFFAGMGLAVALAAVLVELEAWGPDRFTFFATVCTAALVVAPFVHGTTRLLSRYPLGAMLVPPQAVAVIALPVVAINGPRWSLASSGLLFALGVLMLVYHLVIALRERSGDRAYLVASLVSLVALYGSPGSARGDAGAALKLLVLALGYVFYAVDLRERAPAMAARGGA